MIIDCHTHLNNYHEEREPSLSGCLDNLMHSMNRAGVDHALVLSSYKVSPHRPSTRQVVEAVAGYPQISVVAGISYLNYRQSDLRELSEYLQDGLVKGLKLYPGYEPFYPSDPRVRVVYELAMEYSVPVMIHAGDTYSPTAKLKYAHPLQIDEVAVDFPHLNIIICHLGNPWFRDCIEVVYKNANVFADLSGLVLGNFSSAFERYLKKQIDEILLYAGEPSWLLFGSDWPLCDMADYVNFIRKMRLPVEDKEKILWMNSARLFKLDVKPAGPVESGAAGASAGS
ncbi:MAG TPA: amidohydrolase family protein [Candidatus Polarisedimenticolia bacterium]|nr:amidohydrolase family protein [Candidatus Polarisedimenticolia bacterium]